MAKINRVLLGESLVGDGNEVAHIDHAAAHPFAAA
jgi:formaldehyde-activating enzyme involved in methanogenesis